MSACLPSGKADGLDSVSDFAFFTSGAASGAARASL
jgi:hypothetical protein